MSKEGFNTRKYVDSQKEKFITALQKGSGKTTFLEFGGKPFSDHHAARVMPGYDAECKAEILRETVKIAEVVMVVNALDIVSQPDGRKPQGRIRGDSGLVYDKETVRLIDDAHKRQIPIDKVVLAITPRQVTSENRTRIEQFRRDLEKRSVRLLTHFGVRNYPSIDILKNAENPFKDNQPVRAIEDGNLVAISPGGGSGKFGVLLSEMYNALVQGFTPRYVKFETFPIYQLEVNHALNLAFEAATADLKNKVIDIRAHEAAAYRTSYDKDVENFALLCKLFELFGKTDQLAYMLDPVDMGINRIVDGIEDMEPIIAACRREIIARILRYEGELGSGVEKLETVEAARETLGRFEAIYGVTSSTQAT